MWADDLCAHWSGFSSRKMQKHRRVMCLPWALGRPLCWGRALSEPVQSLELAEHSSSDSKWSEVLLPFLGAEGVPQTPHELLSEEQGCSSGTGQRRAHTGSALWENPWFWCWFLGKDSGNSIISPGPVIRKGIALITADLCLIQNTWHGEESHAPPPRSGFCGPKTLLVQACWSLQFAWRGCNDLTLNSFVFPDFKHSFVLSRGLQCTFDQRTYLLAFQHLK